MMKVTCCPQYTIRCNAKDFQMNPSHKKVMKKVRNFLSREQNLLIKSSSNFDPHPINNDNKSEPQTQLSSHEQYFHASSNKNEDTARSNQDIPTSSAVFQCVPKTLEDFLDENYHNPLKKLEIKLVDSTPTELKDTMLTSYRLYVKYQIQVHNDKEEECSLEQFKRFLVNSPLQVLVH